MAIMYRLPSEAEWEYACRGGATSEEECSYHFYFAKPTNDLSSKQANFNGNYPFGKADKGPYLGRTTKVGSYAPNKLGLYDMHGNVWQWCEDLYDPKGLGPGGPGRRLVRRGPRTAGRRTAAGARRSSGPSTSASGLPEFPSGPSRASESRLEQTRRRGQRRQFPLWLAAEPRSKLQRLWQRGKCLDFAPAAIIGGYGTDTLHAFGCIRLNEAEGVWTQTAIRNQAFPASWFELVQELVAFQVFDKVQDVIEGSDAPVPIAEIKRAAKEFAVGVQQPMHVGLVWLED